MTIAISGATGFIGQHLCNRLMKEDIPFICITRPSSDHSFFKKNKIQCINFTSGDASLEHKFQEYQVTGVIHLAAHFVAEHSYENIKDLIESNILYGTCILEASAKAGCDWFLNTGTFWQHYKGATYDPVNLYAATKQAFEDIAKFYVEAHGLKFCTLKLCDTYGPGDRRQKIFNLFAKYAATGEVLEMSPGEQLIDVVHVEEVASAFIKLIKLLNKTKNFSSNCESYYVSSRRKISLKELANEYEKINGVRLNIKWGARPYRKREVMFPVCIGIEI